VAKLRRSIVYSTLAGIIVLSGQARAQTVAANASIKQNPVPSAPASGPADDQIGDIIVTAQKRSESISRVPMSISAASGDQLRAVGVTNVGDLQKIVPGFRYTPSAYSTPIYSIRGIGFNESSLGAKPNVSVYVDEVPLPLSILTRGASLDLERVEVLKGPQGTLFGSNTTGGAINFIAAKPGDHFQAGLDISYGRFDAFDLSGFVSGPVSDTLGVRAAVSTTQGGAWQRSYTRDDKHGREDIINGRLLFDWRPADDVRFEFNVNHLHDAGDELAAHLIAITPLAPARAFRIPLVLSYPLAPRDNRAADFNPGRDYSRDNDQTQVSIRGDFDVTDSLTVTSITSYLDFGERRDVDPDGLALENIEYTTIASIKNFNQELRVAGDFGSTKGIVGVNYEKIDVDQVDTGRVTYDTNAYALGPANPFFDYFNSSFQRFDTKSVFGNLDIDLSETLTAHAAARYTRTTIDFSGCTGDSGNGVLARGWNAVFGTNAQPGGCVTLDATFRAGLVSKSLDEDNVSWRAGLDFKPTADLLFYANVSRGYKAGSYPILSASSASQLVPVTQESVTAYEVGFKTTLAARTLQLTGAAFYYDYRDKQVRGRVIVPVFGPLEALVNVPKSSVRGAELQVLWKPVRGLTANISGTYVDSEIKGFTNYDPYGVLRDFDGEPFPLTSKYQGDADLAYEFPISSRLDAFAGANLNYQSGTNGGLGRLALLDIDAYALLDLRAGIKASDGSWRLSIWGRNVTNRYYWTIADHIADTTVRYTGKPATYGATLSFRIN
jgi:iron complex outermembrane recepter protein